MRTARAAAFAHLERQLARAMTADDPVAAIGALARSRRLPAAWRRALDAAHADGVRMAALLVARLRFERLLRACPEAEAWFERDPEDFARAFRAYHGAVALRAFFPADEAKLFRRWRRAH
jgi:hypothetical protein